MSSMSIAELIRRWDAGEFSDSLDDQIKAGWYDWFCDDKTLRRRAERMMGLVRRISNCGKFDKNTSYVFFKNNCPMVGPTYDSFSVCDMASGDVLYWVGYLKRGCHGRAESGVEVAEVKRGMIEHKFKNANEAKRWFWSPRGSMTESVTPVPAAVDVPLAKIDAADLEGVPELTLEDL